MLYNRASIPSITDHYAYNGTLVKKHTYKHTYIVQAASAEPDLAAMTEEEQIAYAMRMSMAEGKEDDKVREHVKKFIYKIVSSAKS